MAGLPPDEKFLFRMYKSQKTGYFHAVFKTLNGAYQIYTLLRITVAESELPNISFVGGDSQALLVRGDKGRDEWGLHVMPYVYRDSADDTEFYFLVRNGRLVQKHAEQDIR